MSTYLGEDNIKRLINYVLRYIADSDVPVKRYAGLTQCVHHILARFYVYK